MLLGFSGGLDSTVLMHQLQVLACARQTGLRAIHVHHGLQADADVWAEHCRRACGSLGIELLIVRVCVAGDGGQGPEAAARDARYAAFAHYRRDGELLVLAHHRNDQAETVLLRLLRASGSDGLASMRAIRPFGSGSLWRPLLGISRDQLLGYAQAHQLDWIEDPSNGDEIPDRNYLRHRVLPVLAQRWPQGIRALARSAELLAEDAELLGIEADRRLALAAGIDAHTLSVAALLGFEKPWRARMLRRWLSVLGLPALSGQAIGTIETELLLARPDAQPRYRWGATSLRRWRDLLHVGRDQPELPVSWRAPWDGAARLPLPSGDSLAFLPAASATQALPGKRWSVTARQGGERIRLPGRSHSHSLKHCLQEARVPPWLRERLPLLRDADGELLAAGDLVISARLEQVCLNHSLRLHWFRGTGASAI